MECGSCGHKCELLHAIATCVEGVCTPNGCEALYDDCDENPNDSAAAAAAAAAEAEADALDSGGES